jgi:cell division protein FtsI/penicillin-binding protein 2
VTRDVLQPASALVASGPGATHGEETLFEVLPSPPGEPAIASPLRVEYTFDPRLTRRIFELLSERGVQLANIVVMDPSTGRLLAYVSTDTERFPPNRTYPAASLIKVVTAAAALHHDRERAEQPCRFLGSPYQLTPARIDPPRRGQTVTLERALATSNNQCFAQLAVHALGTDAMVDAIKRFGFLRVPAPGHEAGTIDPGTDLYDLGRLGCGLWGCWITPLHAVQLGASLSQGQIVEPWWIQHATDAQGHELELPPHHAPRQVMTPALADELRSMLIETTVSGTARRGFHDRGGNPLLGSIQVAGKTGSLNGTEPAGRYEWFTGVAPADHPSVAIAVVVVLQQRYWLHASQLAGEVLRSYFCESGSCGGEASPSSAAVAPPHTPRHRHRLRARG